MVLWAGRKGIFRPPAAGFAIDFVHLADKGYTLANTRRFFE